MIPDNKENKLPKITAVCCTYGRFSFVERVVNHFLAQTYPNKEMVLYNTHEDPFSDAQCKLLPRGVLIINNSVDSITKEPYTNVGAIRRDALRFASGDYVVTWDDDDVFLPYFMQQAIDRMAETKKPFFKPDKSFFYSGDSLRLVKNTMEASVVGSAEKVREYGYLLDTGREGLGWYTKARDNKELDENDDHCIPSYCFDWETNPTGGFIHRQSGDIDNPNNFDNHKLNTTDFVAGREIRIWSTQDLITSYMPYIEYLTKNKVLFPVELFDRYVGKDFFLSSI
jgi:glycosyltransferase involved in cell wall biosynthesis